MAVIFAEIGQDVHIVGGDFDAAVNEGVALGYTEGFLRKSIGDPLRRENTGDNTPQIIHKNIAAINTPDRLPKGFWAART